eukprot:1543622-Pyramimonas_sp.AAC.1
MFNQYHHRCNKRVVAVGFVFWRYKRECKLTVCMCACLRAKAHPDGKVLAADVVEDSVISTEDQDGQGESAMAHLDSLALEGGGTELGHPVNSDDPSQNSVALAISQGTFDKN